jgi:hypothetical protein
MDVFVFLIQEESYMVVFHMMIYYIHFSSNKYVLQHFDLNSIDIKQLFFHFEVLIIVVDMDNSFLRSFIFSALYCIA